MATTTTQAATNQEEYEAALVCVLFHMLIDPNGNETKDVLERESARFGNLTRTFINEKIDELNDLQTPTVRSNFGTHNLRRNSNLFRNRIGNGRVRICTKPLYAPNDETKRLPCLHNLVTAINRLFTRAIQKLIKDSSFMPWVIFATVFIEERPAQDVLDLEGAVHHVNSSFVNHPLQVDLTTATAPPTASAVIPISEALHIPEDTNFFRWPFDNNRTAEIQTLNNRTTIMPPPPNLRTLQVYENSIGNIERGKILQIIRGRIGQLNYQRLLDVCVRYYNFLDENALEQFFDNLLNVPCIMPGNQQGPNTVSWNAHFFDDIAYELLRHAKPKFESFRASNPQQHQLGTRASAVLAEAGQACACINQSM
jgi:hypothetical protein